MNNSIKNVLVATLGCTLIACGGGGGKSVTVTISPTTATVPAGATQQYTGTVQNSTDTTVSWRVDGITGGNALLGTISTSGLYTAPQVPPAGGSVTVAAVAQADATKSATAATTIVFSDASLQGNYAFVYSGADTAGGFMIAGSFVANGGGTISNGVEDVNHDTGVTANVSFAGTYSVGSDGLGFATITSSLGTTNLSFVLTSPGQARILSIDSAEWASGFIEKQDPTAFADAALNGIYIFNLMGISPDNFIGSKIGRFNGNGLGAIPWGDLDINNGGTVTQNVTFNGTYNIASNGRGVAALSDGVNTETYAVYVVSSNSLWMVSLDFLPAYLGQAIKQDNVAFSNSSVSGDMVFVESGVTTLGGYAAAGRTTANGSGGLSSGISDSNNAGVLSDGSAFTGTYDILSVGYGTATLDNSLGTSSILFYLISPNEGMYIGGDSTAVTAGSFVAQQPGSGFSTSSISGSYGFNGSGSSVKLLGQVDANGSGGLSGLGDINDLGTVTTDVPVTGTYNLSANGRGTGSITPQGGVATNIRIHAADGARLVFIFMDNTGALKVGGARRQY